MRKNEIYIITGASRGIGAALATQLEEDGATVLRLARTNPKNYPNLTTGDITEYAATLTKINQWLEPKLNDATNITLINNAGVVEPIGLVGDLELNAIEAAISINMTAVIALTNGFIKLLRTFKGEKKILNISSGAARKPYRGWGLYCATKAAVDHFSRVVAEEEKEAQYPVTIASLAPGVIETSMQERIRASRAEDFPHLDRFLRLKAEDSLATPEETATAIIRYLKSNLMSNENPIVDLREIASAL